MHASGAPGGCTWPAPWAGVAVLQALGSVLPSRPAPAPPWLKLQLEACKTPARRAVTVET